MPFVRPNRALRASDACLSRRRSRQLLAQFKAREGPVAIGRTSKIPSAISRSPRLLNGVAETSPEHHLVHVAAVLSPVVLKSYPESFVECVDINPRLRGELERPIIVLAPTNSVCQEKL